MAGPQCRLLDGELAPPLGYLALGVGARSLPLLKGMSLLRREPSIRPWREGPR
jgi:hypothetical protein